MFSFIVVLACGLFALYYAYDTSKRVFSAGTGTEEMQKIAGAIQEGAQAYLNRQYKTIAIVGVIVAVLLAWALSGLVALGFVLGAVLSGVAGYIGMNVSVRANIRTTEAARQGMTPALNVAFQAGAVTGLLVVGLGLLGVVLYYGLLTMFGVEQKTMLEALVALSFGASLISIFARLGGGIFTKGADVGADLVGKVEAGIPEDDPRNPAVIADNVGDNVGDCAGMAADLFETYAVTVVATMLLAAIYFTGELQHLMMMYPLLIGGVCILGSVFGTKYVRLGSDNNIMKALYRGLTVAALASAGLIIVVTFLLFWGAPEMQIQGKTFGVGNLLMCSLTGLVITAALVWITEYYTATAFRPVRSIAQASTTGHGTNVIQGLAVSMESTALPVIVISIGILFYRLNLMGTFVGVIIIHVLNSMMFMTWIPSGAFRGVYRQQEESARDAGAGPFRTFFRITLPLAMPGIAVASVFTFLGSLEEAQGTLLVGFPQVKTMPVELYGVIMEYPLTAGPVLSLILIIPTVLILFLMRKYINADNLSQGYGMK